MVTLYNWLLFPVIVLAIICTFRWAVTIRRENFRGFPAATVRLYFVITYLMIAFLPPDADLRAFLVRCGVFAWLFDEALAWLLASWPKIQRLFQSESRGPDEL